MTSTTSTTSHKSLGVIIFAPQGSGKSSYAAALARHYRKTRIVDEWTPGGPLPADTIALTSVPVRGSVYLLDALDAAQIKVPAPYRQALAAARGGA